MNSKLRLPLLAASVLYLTGCDELEPYLPTVSFNRFDVKDIDFKDADIDFVLVSASTLMTMSASVRK